jgi:hypothetical protein
MHENKYNHYRIPAGLLIVFLEKALTLIHMETHLNDVSTYYYEYSGFIFYRMRKSKCVHYLLHY